MSTPFARLFPSEPTVRWRSTVPYVVFGVWLRSPVTDLNRSSMVSRRSTCCITLGSLAKMPSTSRDLTFLQQGCGKGVIGERWPRSAMGTPSHVGAGEAMETRGEAMGTYGNEHARRWWRACVGGVGGVEIVWMAMVMARGGSVEIVWRARRVGHTRR